MIASFHLLEYKERVLSPPKRLAGRTRGLRYWRPFDIGGDFAWFREHPSRWALYRKLKPDFHRWAFYGLWDDEGALTEFLEQSELASSWRDACSQRWHALLQPIRANGPWEGVRLLEEEESSAAPIGPVAHLVRLDLSLRGTIAMWASAAPHVLRHLPDSEDLLLGVPLVDRPYTQPVSFSVWRSEKTALAFAYRGHGHPDAVVRVQRSQSDLKDRYSSASFSPYRSERSWNGKNPLENEAVTSA